MARKSRLTPLGVAALALLAERAMHPYEMYQLLLQRSEDRLVKVRPGTLYHTVARLEEDGLVESAGTCRDGNRPERTTYSILPVGRDTLGTTLRDLLAEPAREYPSFPLAVAEAHNLPAAVVLGLLEQRLARLREELGKLDDGAAAATARAVAPRYWIDVRYQQAMLRAEIDWITGLRTDLASGALDWEPGKKTTT
ncbi:PadR family transcriptional regulator [Specibacter cremeus]|uniref:PadR family transcriptional regulator n=1 Tax=Specibacter cremeus TaxID=1629051 RepID=UPI000F7A3614|nr:PadR family transcriptional regulator [Specibacter cremeus]